MMVPFEGMAQERVQPSKEPGILLSELLPDSLADFVVRTGADRSLDQELAEKVWEFYEGRVGFLDRKAFIELLQPVAYSTVYGPVTVLHDEVPTEAEARGTEARSLLLAVTTVFVYDGVEVEPGGELVLGDVIMNGLVLNAGDVPVIAEVPGSEQETIPAGAILAVKSAPCSVRCRAGYYACCRTDWNERLHCNCVRDDRDASCNIAGGPGATACSCGEAAQVDG
jgi:hypothetical protein